MTTAWQLDRAHAQLHTSQLQAELDLRFPQYGLNALQLAGQPLLGRMLALELVGNRQNTGQAGSAAASSSEESLVEAYLRQDDLVATYAQSPMRPFRPQVYWRAIAQPDLPSLGAVENIVSIQTNLLDSRPTIEAQTVLPIEACLLPTDASLEQFHEVDLARGAHEIDSELNPGCVLFRLPSQSASYAELIPPNDFQTAEVLQQTDGMVQLRYALFGRFLEKGVILRARRRGVFLPRQGDLQAAAAWYHAILRSELPLTT